ncbi:MAG: hypothetical protein SGI72_10810 [Planctomycetota bacterium]|nr:hypothetical protein [Planctomycetota bacterium]
MWSRVFAVFRAGFEAQWGRGTWPVAPLVVHGSITATFALLVGDVLPPYAYAVFMLSLAMALIALPLLGDFGFLLRADPSREWIEAQPVRAFELRVARTMLVMLLAGALAASALLPIVLFAPASVGFGERIALFVAGLAQAAVVAGFLLGLQSLFGRRAEALLVLLQTLLVGGVLVGCLLGLQVVPQLLAVKSPADLAHGFEFSPSAWFATSVVSADVLTPWWRLAPWIAFSAAALVLFVAPQATAPIGRKAGFLSALLAPLRALASRTWVRREERGSFDLVFDALPLEREFVLRTYPMIAIPLAMLFAGSGGSDEVARDGLVAVLLFTPATYLPVLLVHVPATASSDARWILDGAPVSRAAIHNGALKALAVRFLVPLYVMLFALAWTRSGLAFALMLAPLGFLVSVVVNRPLYALCVSDLPLSRDANDIKADMNWMGHILTLGIVLTIAAIIALKFVTSFGIALIVCAALVLLEWNADRKEFSKS